MALLTFLCGDTAATTTIACKSENLQPTAGGESMVIKHSIGAVECVANGFLTTQTQTNNDTK